MLLGQKGLEASECVSKKRFGIVEGCWLDNKGLNGLICVYGPTDGNDIVAFLDDWAKFVSLWDCRNFVIFGDFNAILFSKERWGINGYCSASEELDSFIDSLELQDQPLVGSKFIFFKSGLGRARSILDIFFVRHNDSGWFEEVTPQVVFKFSYDHLPIGLSSVVISNAPRSL